MNNAVPDSLSGRLLRLLAESSQRSSTLHQQFLQTRRASMQNMRALIEMQIAGAASERGFQPAALFDSRQLDEFGSGQISRCLGPAFARYDQRRIPRIPNGDLKMMSRVVAISGHPFSSVPQHAHLSGSGLAAAVTVEYDVPPDAWYLRDSAYPDVPYSLYMEIALQPCGFLSAYLDTYSLVPCDSFFFRNLDGSARILAEVDVRGKTITTRANLLSSVASGGTVIQRFAFELSCAGQAFYAGESTFGYFSTETMSNQMGLDGGQSPLPAFRTGAGPAGHAISMENAASIDTRRWRAVDPARPHFHLSYNRLHFLDEVQYVPSAGRYGRGYLYASRLVNPRDWFYPYHFYGDPVMPGSLGIEAILEAMQAFALSSNLGAELHSPHFGPLAGAAPMTWRYRGQITQQHKRMELEVHLSAVERQVGRIALLGDANLWVDGLRIYEVKNAAVGILQGEA